MTITRSFAALLCCVALAACSDEKNAVQTISAPAPGSAVKFYNFSGGAPSVNFFADESKLTAVISTSGVEATSGTAVGGVAAGGFYTAIAPGSYTLSGRIAAATDNGLPIAAAASTLADGKYYSFYLTGAYNTTTKKSDWFMVEDPIPTDIDYVNTQVRFVNGVYTNAGPLTLWAKNTVTGDSVSVGGAVAYKSAGAFVTMPSAVYDLTLRNTGSNTAVVSRTGVSFVAGRVYTVSGRPGAMDNTANR